MNWTVQTADLVCHRCLGQLYLLLRIPGASPIGAHRPAVAAIRVVPLCPRCDALDSSAHGLLSFFAMYAEVDANNAQEFAGLVEEWVQQLPPPKAIDRDSLEAEITAWRNGEFDVP